MYNRWPKYRLCTGSRLSSFSSSLLCSAVSVSVREQGVHRTGHFVNFNSIWASVLRFSAWAKCMIHAEFETWWVPLDLVWNFCLHKWLVFQEFCLRVNRNCWGLLNILKTGNENVDQFSYVGNWARYEIQVYQVKMALSERWSLLSPHTVLTSEDEELMLFITSSDQSISWLLSRKVTGNSPTRSHVNAWSELCLRTCNRLINM